APLSEVRVIDAQQRQQLLNHARSGGFWFATVLAIVWLVTDIVYVVTGPYPTALYVWIGLRSILLPVLGYFLGQIGGVIALRRVISPDEKLEITALGAKNGQNKAKTVKVSKTQQLQQLSGIRAREEARDLVPNDLPLQSKGAWRFYLLLLFAF